MNSSRFWTRNGSARTSEDLARHARRRPSSRVMPFRRSRNSSPPTRATVSSCPDAAPEAVGDLHEELVAGRVAERVVHALEVVEVEEHDDERLAAPLRVQDREREPVVEEDAVRQVGQRVVVRLVPALLLGALAVRDVDEAAFHHALAAAARARRGSRSRGPTPGVPSRRFRAELEVHEDPLVREPGEEGLPGRTARHRGRARRP